MRKDGLFLALALGLGLTVALLCLLGSSPTQITAASNPQPQQTQGSVITVCLSGGCDYSAVQAAVDAASDYDTIKVAAGTYTDVHVRPRTDIRPPTGFVTQVVYLAEKSLTIQGGYTTTNWITPNPDANPTVLDAQGQGRVLYITGNMSSTVEGLRITGGDAKGLGGPTGPYDVGGGIFVVNATVTIHNCRVFNNTATFGGGLYLFNYAGVSTLINSTVSSNTAFDGGGLYLFEGSAGGRGAVLSGNTVISNTANRGGGGLNLLANNATLINNIVADNRADGAGSGLSIYGSSPRLLHNTIARNTGGDNTGVYVAGGGYGGYSTVILTNTILVSHTVGISVTGGSTVTINDILWYNTPITVSQATTATVTVQNQHTGDPAFAPDGYHLTLGSAAIGKGVDAGVTTDIDGDSRPAPAGTHPDLGADEVSQQRVYLPLITRNYQP